ncbi:MAG: hypothetical protein CMK44_04710 [Porticoccus sp.]|jgi:hypothetical protein|nr:hypothetical protein [Porticoccus sp.]
MFGIFKKNPLKKLKDEYEAKLKDAMEAQRSGDIFNYSQLSKEADIIHKKIKLIESETDDNN